MFLGFPMWPLFYLHYICAPLPSTLLSRVCPLLGPWPAVGRQPVISSQGPLAVRCRTAVLSSPYRREGVTAPPPPTLFWGTKVPQFTIFCGPPIFGSFSAFVGQDGKHSPKMGQHSTKMGQHSPKMGQHSSKMAPEWSQDLLSFLLLRPPVGPWPAVGRKPLNNPSAPSTL